MFNASDSRRPTSSGKEPPDALPEEGILLGYSLEHERRTAPIGFSYGEGTDRLKDRPAPASPTLDPILHTGGGHLMTIAPTGAGKGIGCIIPSLLRYPGPVIVVDPKGENYAVTVERRRALGQEVVVLDPIGITGAPDPGALNPLDLVDTNEAQSIDDAAALASLLSGGIEKEDPKNLFWYQRGEQLLTGLIQLVALTRRGPDRTLGEVRRILNLPAEDFIQLASTQMAHSPDVDVRQVAGTLINPAQEMVGSILSMAQNSLGFLRGELLHTSTGTSSFSLDDVTAGAPLSIYIVIPPDKLESHRNLLRVWIGSLMSALMRRRSPVRRSTLLILDEAAQLGPLDQLRQAVTLMRGYGLQTWSFWQDVSQLLNLYPRDWETMYNNCRVHQAFGFTTLKAAAATCDLLGFHDPLEALQLDVDEMILSVSGDEAVIAQKPNYLTDPAFDGLYEPNPFYTQSADAPPTPTRPTRVYVRPAVETTDERDTDDRGDSGEPGDSSESDAQELARVGEFQALLEKAARDPVLPEDPAREARPRVGLLDPLPDVILEKAAALPAMLELIVDRLGGSWNPITAHVRGISPSFWGKHYIVEISDAARRDDRRLAIIHDREVRPFHGRPNELETLRRELPTNVSDETVADWVRVYLHFDRVAGVPYRVVESLDQLRYWTGAYDVELDEYESHLHPIRVLESDETAGWTLDAVELIEGRLGSIRVSVARDGRILGTERGPVLATLDLPIDYPTLGLDGEVQDPEVADELRDIHGRWGVMSEIERRTAVRKISANTDHPLDPDAVVLRRALRSCPGFELVRVLGSDSLKYTFALYGPGIAFLLASLHPGYLRAFGQGLLGTDDVPLRLDDPEAIKEWVRLHTWSMTRSNEEYALCLDRYDQLPLDPLVEPDPEVRDRLRARWVPMTVSPPRDDDPEGLVARVAATTLHEARVAYAHFTVSRDGEVELDESEEDVDRLPLDEARLGRLLAMPPLGVARSEDVPVGAASDAAHAGGGS